MNQAVAQLAAQLKKNNPVLVAAEAVAVSKVEDPNAKCMMQYAHLVAKALLFLSNPVVTNQFIAAIASNPEDPTKF
jgi:hypothetical protein